jgi:hypothetical protein
MFSIIAEAIYFKWNNNNNEKTNSNRNDNNNDAMDND